MTTPSDHGASPDLGWARAVLSGLAVLVVGIGLCVFAINTVMTRLTGVSRDVRQWIALTAFMVVLLAIAWTLRRLQARGLI